MRLRSALGILSQSRPLNLLVRASKLAKNIVSNTRHFGSSQSIHIEEVKMVGGEDNRRGIFSVIPAGVENSLEGALWDT